MAASTLAKMARFVLWGVPAFLIAIPLNYVLVERAAMSKPAAYAVVLTVQVTLNFFACRWFVFEGAKQHNLWKSFVLFCNGILAFRALDWAVYSLLTTQCGVPFLAAQLLNVALFGLLKFLFARRVFEARPGGPPPVDPTGAAPG
jgi:putative flippase GtrA